MVKKIKKLIKPSWFISKREIEYCYIEDKLKETNELVSRLEKENQMLLSNFIRNGISGLNEYYLVDETFRIRQTYTHHIKSKYQEIINRLGFTTKTTTYQLVEKNEESYIFKGTQRECECYIKEVRENLDIKEL